MRAEACRAGRANELDDLQFGALKLSLAVALSDHDFRLLEELAAHRLILKQKADASWCHSPVDTKCRSRESWIQLGTEANKLSDNDFAWLQRQVVNSQVRVSQNGVLLTCNKLHTIILIGSIGPKPQGLRCRVQGLGDEGSLGFRGSLKSTCNAML